MLVGVVSKILVSLFQYLTVSEHTFAFAREELKATIRMFLSICEDMYLILEQITSMTG